MEATRAPVTEIATTKTPTSTPAPLHTETLTPAPVPSNTESACQVLVHGSYNFPKVTEKDFSMGPGIYFFYDFPGGGKYGNDKAGCELNIDCTQLRAINKDSAEANPEGVMGPWVDNLTGEKSSATWSQYIVTCSLAPEK
jgi:hypothetical protein